MFIGAEKMTISLSHETTHASMSVTPSSFSSSCTDMVVSELPDFNPVFWLHSALKTSHRAGCTQAKMVLSVPLLASLKGILTESRQTWCTTWGYGALPKSIRKLQNKPFIQKFSES